MQGAGIHRVSVVEVGRAALAKIRSAQSVRLEHGDTPATGADFRFDAAAGQPARQIQATRRVGGDGMRYQVRVIELKAAEAPEAQVLPGGHEPQDCHAFDIGTLKGCINLRANDIDGGPREVAVFPAETSGSCLSSSCIEVDKRQPVIVDAITSGQLVTRKHGVHRTALVRDKTAQVERHVPIRIQLRGHGNDDWIGAVGLHPDPEARTSGGHDPQVAVVRGQHPHGVVQRPGDCNGNGSANAEAGVQSGVRSEPRHDQGTAVGSMCDERPAVRLSQDGGSQGRHAGEAKESAVAPGVIDRAAGIQCGDCAVGLADTCGDE